MTDFSELDGHFTLKGDWTIALKAEKDVFGFGSGLLNTAAHCGSDHNVPVTCWRSHNIDDAQNLDAGQEVKSSYDTDRGGESVNMLEANCRSSVYWLDIL